MQWLQRKMNKKNKEYQNTSLSKGREVQSERGRGISLTGWEEAEYIGEKMQHCCMMKYLYTIE